MRFCGGFGVLRVFRVFGVFLGFKGFFEGQWVLPATWTEWVFSLVPSKKYVEFGRQIEI